MDLLQTHQTAHLQQNNEVGDPEMPSLVKDETMEKPILGSHNISASLILKNHLNCHERVEISSPPDQPPQQLLQDAGPPSPPTSLSSAPILSTNGIEIMPS